MIRAVLDTNIVVSAMLSPLGPPARVLTMVIQQKKAQLCVSADIFSEYEEVISRAKFKRTNNEITAMLGSIRETGFWVKPINKVHVCDDPDDDIFLECAEAAAADHLVTGNLTHFPHARWGRVDIVTARTFISLLDID